MTKNQKHLKRRKAFLKKLKQMNLYIPSSVIAVKFERTKRGLVRKALVCWEGYSPNDCTWEPLSGKKDCPIERQYNIFIKEKTEEVAEILRSLYTMCASS